MYKVSIITAAFNECPQIVSLIEHWCSYLEKFNKISNYEIIICDDFSDYSQYEYMTKSFLNNPNITVIRNLQNEGPGYSLNRAIRLAKYDWTLITDSDGQFLIDNLDRLIECLENNNYDAIFTYRNKKYDNFFNVIGQKISNYLCNRIYNSKLTDFTCAFKLVRTSLLLSLKFDAKYMNYSLDHTAKLLLSECNYYETEVLCKVIKTRKRSFINEINRARFRFYYIVYLYFTRNLLKKKVIF